MKNQKAKDAQRERAHGQAAFASRFSCEAVSSRATLTPSTNKQPRTERGLLSFGVQGWAEGRNLQS